MISEDEKFRKLFQSMPRFETPQELVSKVYHLIENEDIVEEREKIYNYFNIKIRRLKTYIVVLATALIILFPIMFFYIRPTKTTHNGTVYIVKFVYRDESARNIHIVGDFNGWDKKGIPMRKIKGTNIWVAEISLKSGTYRYNFLVNGNQWAIDPFSNIKIKDKFGHESSVLVLLQSENKENKL